MGNCVREISEEEFRKLFPHTEQRTINLSPDNGVMVDLRDEELEFWRDFRRLTLLKKKAGDINSILTHILHECERLEKKVEEGLEKYDVELKIKGVENE
jgi:hypothetical protein